ncbi:MULTISPECIES: amino acid ABC transporter permease [Atopobiaceae]|uniref:amino acid ABC transporter permease n=1 Tax=Atopobiaceae TaxID=1643824 RepID=UPI00034E55A2|nr:MULTISPECIES: amino acid ABC transporter permease [Atopobiaceae]EPD78273.1 polar amino acid transport system permease [Atopobium sp. oral taxon 199 str. F0494]
MLVDNILLQDNVIARLMGGLWVTVEIGLLSAALSIPLGILVGVMMTSRKRVARAVLRLYLEIVRVMPQLVLLYVVFFGTAAWFDVNLDGFEASIVVFTFWGAAELGDLVRAALESIPCSQYDSAFALGLSKKQTLTRIVLPQAVTRLLPPAINLMTRMIKTTALCNLIGVVELIRVGSQITDFYRFQFPTTGALWVYGTVFFLYFAACSPLSLIARRLERRMR